MEIFGFIPEEFLRCEWWLCSQMSLKCLNQKLSSGCLGNSIIFIKLLKIHILIFKNHYKIQISRFAGGIEAQRRLFLKGSSFELINYFIPIPSVAAFSDVGGLFQP